MIRKLFLKLTHTDCEKLILSSFIECFDGNYSGLKRFRFIPIPKNILILSWGLVYENYCLLSDNSGYSEMNLTLKSLYKKDSKILSIKCALLSLRSKYSQQSVDILRSFGYDYKFDFNNKSSFYSDLKRVAQKIKTIQTEIDRDKKKLEKLKKDKTTNDDISSIKESFKTNLIYFSKYMGGSLLRGENITVSEYCRIMNSINTDILNKQNDERNR